VTDYLKRPHPVMYRDPSTGRLHTSQDGCWAYHTCLACPLPRCVHDSRVTPAAIDRLSLHVRITELLDTGETYEAVAATLSTSRRTVARVAAASRKSKARSPRAASSLAS